MTTADDVLAKVRPICLGFPDATEQRTWDHPTFRVRGKIFAGFGPIEPGDERSHLLDRGGRPAVASMSMKAPPGEQELLLAEGEPFFFPAYVGPRGWIGIVLGAGTDYAELTELLEDSYRLVAPARLAAQLDE